ncbi:hypothetical protein [Finegoldia magna]|uniref:hypothetical protein n=1 Tax=Finegoldia magna TaxID=1260 RepID=UPI0029039ADE|nr:hypothetical protein [Finegoldia magna]MDU1579493.1 hypothetical protein [Finegoldia magna]MDU1600099.1 hypothetical protein [Finegoldia magna]
MSTCPYYKRDLWNGEQCDLIDDIVPRDCSVYCQPGLFADAQYWKECRIYRNYSSSGGCFLTSACMANQMDKFDDNCEELTILRNFRDTYVKEKYPSSIDEYYVIAPKIVKKIDSLGKKNEIYNHLYNELVQPSVKLIKNNEYEEAYNLYKDVSLELSKDYL